MLETIRKKRELLQHVDRSVENLKDSPDDPKPLIYLLSHIITTLKQYPGNLPIIKELIGPEIIRMVGADINTTSKKKTTPVRKATLITESPGGIYKRKKGNKGYFDYRIHRINGVRKDIYLGKHNKLSNEAAGEIEKKTNTKIEVIRGMRATFKIFYNIDEEKYIGYLLIPKKKVNHG